MWFWNEDVMEPIVSEATYRFVQESPEHWFFPQDEACTCDSCGEASDQDWGTHLDEPTCRACAVSTLSHTYAHIPECFGEQAAAIINDAVNFNGYLIKGITPEVS